MFEIGMFDVSELASSFDNLPLDEYTPTGNRFRRLGNFKTNLDWGHTNYVQVSSDITQPADVNSYLGDVVREYAPIEQSTLESSTFRRMVLHMQRTTGWMGDFSLHQIRISAFDGLTAEPAPEGIHRDGYEFIMPYMVGFDNVKGGEAQIFTNEKKILVNMKPVANSYLMFKDREIMHFGAPVKQREMSRPAHWDAFVFACNKD